jgi:hypothetical protein
VDNEALGYQALNANTTGSENLAMGYQSMAANTAGSQNVAVGNYTLQNNLSGSNNTAVGIGAGVSLTGGDNNTMIGKDAQVPNASGSNQIRIGNSSITYAGVQVAWTITSDSRYKSGIENSELGLDFINTLRPVSYVRKNDRQQKEEFGFIAQEVEDALKQAGVDNTGIITKDDGGLYSMRYNDLLAPMVKAIQEQQQQIKLLQQEIASLKKKEKKGHRHS